MSFRIALALAVLAGLAACSAEPGFLLEGKLLDAETGKPVSRKHAYVHFFCDEIGVQKSLELEDDSAFSVRMPRPKVRIRVADLRGVYELFERTVEVEGESLEYDVRLTPTHFVLLRGRLIRAANGKPLVPTGGGEKVGGGPLLYFDAESVGWQKGMVWPEEDGTFAVRVPRAKITIRAVNTPLAIRNPVVDLTGFEGEERGVQVVFEKTPR